MRRDKTPRGFALVLALCTAVGLAMPAGAQHRRDWSHDHSSSGVPYRPRGLQELKQRFGGSACNASANDARTWFPHAKARWEGNYVYYHPYLARNVGYNIRVHIDAAHRDNAIDYGVYGYACRQQTGGSNYSTHSWGAAIDTNTARNPYGQSNWNGRGADGYDYGTYIPSIYRDHNFYWGRNFSTPDPHHFQYVTGY